MKGLANSVGAATIFAFGRHPGANGQSLRQGTTGSGRTARAADTGPRMEEITGANAWRGLQSADHRADGETDDALDVNGTPLERAENVLRLREEWALNEFLASRSTLHFNNGDRSSAASFHKTLPHDEFGQVDEDAFKALIACVSEGTIETCDRVPAGGSANLSNPIAGIAVDMAGPASTATTVPPAPLLNSADLAAQLAEVYWMALTRDVHFSKYGVNEETIAAADNLAGMSGFANMNGVAVDADGRPDPQQQLFRSTAVGVETGPMISQLLLRNVTIDSITVSPLQSTFKDGADYMTAYDDWLSVQNGGDPVDEKLDHVERYIRNGRDLSRLVATDTIYTEAFRAALVLLAEGAISMPGVNGPYVDSTRQVGFVNFGVSHLMKILGAAEFSQRSSWYQKWNVHMFPRPEAVGGTLHNVLNGNVRVHLHRSIRKNDELLERVAARNEELNGPGDRTFLLSQAVPEGSPTHPSYPAGHAVQNGAFATVLKAFVGLERATSCFKDPVFPDDEGLELLPFTGECLTFEGEINKMAVNIAFGRQMCGVHYRMDSEEGLRQGEIASVRALQQEIRGFPERAGYEFRLFSGETIRLEPDGTFYVDDRECSGDAFEGAALC